LEPDVAGAVIPVNEPLLGAREKQLLAECIDTGWVSSDGPRVRQFEEQVAASLGVKHAVAVSNGTVALELAVAALGLGPGDEVIIPSHTIISCALAVVRRGATPVFVDVDPDTWTLDPVLLERAVTPRTRAVMPVHIYGHPCDMDAIEAVARRHKLFIIEDAAEAQGALYKGRACGGLGDVSTLSFYANKLVTTGEGGMLLTSQDHLAAQARLLRNLCFLPEQRFLHQELGYNFRMTNLQAALGVAQMERVDQLVETKRAMGARYTQRLKGLHGAAMQTVRTWAAPVFWVFGLVLDDAVPMDARQWAHRLMALGIQTRPFFWPLHEQPALQAWPAPQPCPVTSRLARRGLYLPSGMALTPHQADQVCDAVEQTLRAGAP
jgi:perosamine synthetase